jgi:hypothetical protein
LDALRLGATRRAAAAAGGFARQTFYEMIKDPTLLTEVEKAEAEAEFTHVSNIARASIDPKNWTASAWWLERRHPDDFGRRDRLEVKVDMRTVVQKAAAERGLDESEVMAEVERIMADAK